ncbi:uncharacterized protein E0L32_007060 [Thyridium curvatum]|uniref:Uncharacterized protein n=1 Tax=Thyridium curvatum TaxID=1093900 RepID=A0A507B0D4_9PEZI|nr:uncharacterized protein E0L32_007060 [Thyridium curvatum]TPX12174.1 hypothetical protein E0L32_007060 [Thyridium curvatum]
MLAARRASNACPQCRQQLQLLFEHGFSSPTPTLLARRRMFPASLVLAPSGARHRAAFATSRIVRQDGRVETTPKRGDEDVEAIVRQAKEMFGDTLPAGYLSQEEFKLYTRLYGEPLRSTTAEDVGLPARDEGDNKNTAQMNTLFREGEHGGLEEVLYTLDTARTATEEVDLSLEIDVGELRPPTAAQIDYLNAHAKSKREYDALLKLQRDFEAASLRPLEEEEIEEEPEEEPEEEEDEDFEDEPGAVFHTVGETGGRLHNLTREGLFGTNPSTVHLPKDDMVLPITELLGRTDTKHIRQTAEKVFGGPGLPYSVATPQSKKNLPQKGIAMQATQHRMSEIEADAYIATVFPGVYSSAMSALVEVRKRLGSEWIRGLLARRDGHAPRVLDVGAGGAGLAAWNDVFKAEWDALRERGEVQTVLPPEGKKAEKTVIVGSDNLRHRVSRFLHNTTFLPRLPDYLHSAENVDRLLDAPATPQPRKTYDIIIASHLLMPLDKDFKRKDLIDNLWAQLNPEGGLLIVLEKGHPRGFEAVADARMRILEEYISPHGLEEAANAIEQDSGRIREPGMVVAPCTNQQKCPMYLNPGLTPGRKDFCHFSQRFIRPPFLQKILGATHRNHEDVRFSYVAVRRGEQLPTPQDAAEPPARELVQGAEATDRAFTGYEGTEDLPHPLSLPRSILPPLKRHGHVTFDLCTPAGHIERWTVPRSFSKKAYHDARKASWGDLWALGAKTRVRRDIRLGRGGKTGAIPLDGGVRAANAVAEAGKKAKPRVIELHAGPDGIHGASEKFPRGRAPRERRSKRGRRQQIKDLLQELKENEFTA